MAIQFKRRGLADRVPIDMTPMIDVVFQLLIFFCLTLRIATAEGDFNIKMPVVAAQPGAAEQGESSQHFRLEMRANAAGDLAELQMAGQSFTGAGDERWTELRQFIAGQVGSGSPAETPEVTLDFDYKLKYEYVMRAITAVSGDIGPDGRIIKLIEKINFAPRPAPQD